MYATYEFYTTEYHGDKIATEEAFEKYGTRASDFLDRCTRRKLESGLPSKADDLKKIQKACCAIADAYVDIETATKSAEASAAQGGAIKSISSGGESISFESSALSLAVAGGAGAVNRYLLEIAKDYLSLVANDYGEYYLYWGLE